MQCSNGTKSLNRNPATLKPHLKTRTAKYKPIEWQQSAAACWRRACSPRSPPVLPLPMMTKKVLTYRYTRLVNTWDVQVTTRDCQTNAVLRTFASILTYNMVAVPLESIAGIPQSVKTPGKACGAPSATTPITLNLSRCDLMPAAISRVRSRFAKSSI